MKNSTAQFIQTSQELAQFCQKLLTPPTPKFVALDTEFLREKTYWPQLCLIQLATPCHRAVIDALAPEIDLSPFFEVLYDTEITKVFHAAQQDLEIFHHYAMRFPEPIFDTQIAAMALGLGDNLSYQKLVEKLLYLRLDKTAQRTNWSLRPLTTQQWDYALQDVIHLAQLYPQLQATLLEKGRRTWIKEALAHLTDEKTYRPRIDRIVKQLRGLPTRMAKTASYTVLRALCQWREEQAMCLNWNRRMVLPDETLVALALNLPQAPQDLKNLKSLHLGSHIEKNDLLACIQTSLKGPHSEKTSLRTDTSPSDLLELLKILLKRCCAQACLSPLLVASATDLEHIAGAKNPNCLALEGWRWEIFGQWALALKAGRIALGVENETVKIVHTPSYDI